MTFLGPAGDAFVRVAHVGSVILWIGLLHFAVFIRPRMMAGLSEGAMREAGPHLAARMVPWMLWTPLVALATGVLLYLDMLGRFTFAGMGWGIHLGAVLGFVMVGLVHAVSLPAMKRTAAVLSGSPPPPPALFARAMVVAWLLVVLSWVVLILMVFSAHWPVLR